MNPDEVEPDLLEDADYPGDDVLHWQDLLDEFEAQRFGLLWLQEVRKSTAQVVQRYDPRRYSGSQAWDHASIEDLVQDVVLDKMLREAQVDYICATAQDGTHARRLVRRCIRHELISRRNRSVIDNLLDRAKEYLTESGCPSSESTPRVWSKVWPPDLARRNERSDEVRLEARLRRLPRLAARGDLRASPVWSAATLITAINDILDTLGAVTEHDLDRLLRGALTSLTLGDLVLDEPETFGSDSGLDPEEVAVAKQQATALVKDLPDEERVVMALKLTNRSDADVAQVLGISRPTVDKRKRAAWVRAQGHLIDLQPTLVDEVLRQVADLLLAEFQLEDEL